MRIALVVPEYPPYGIGGGAVVFAALCREYRSRHQVRVFAGHDPLRSWSARARADEGDPDVCRYPLAPLAAGRPHLRTVVPPGRAAAADLRRDLRAWRPDVAHLHGYGYAIVDFAALLLRRRHVPYVFTNHGYPTTPATRGATVRLLYGAYRRLGAERTLAGAAGVTAISRSVLSGGGTDGHGVVIPNGLTPFPPSTADGRSQLRERLGLGASTRVVAAAGRLATSKGFDVLIDAVSRLPNGDIACVVAGLDGGAGAALRSQAGRCGGTAVFAFPGPLSRQDLADLFASASVVAVPSRDEPFGLVALEAVAGGTRVVASAVGGLPEFLPPAIATFVPPDDPVALAAALVGSLAAGTLTAEERAVAADLSAAHDWRLIATRYEAMLAAAAGASGRSGATAASGGRRP